MLRASAPPPSRGRLGGGWGALGGNHIGLTRTPSPPRPSSAGFAQPARSDGAEQCSAKPRPHPLEEGEGFHAIALSMPLRCGGFTRCEIAEIFSISLLRVTDQLIRIVGIGRQATLRAHLPAGKKRIRTTQRKNFGGCGSRRGGCPPQSGRRRADSRAVQTCIQKLHNVIGG